MNAIPRLVLASASPRRSNLLSQIGLKFEICPSNIPEVLLEKDSIPEKVTQELSYQKAKVVSEKCPDAVVIGADTLVSLGDELLGKPDNDAHANEMLHKLNGTSHKVVTGVSLIYRAQNLEITWAEVTNVHFRELSNSEITKYIETGEASDKAGAYGIQGRAAAFVKKIDGCYFNVVGLPLASLMEHLLDSIPDVIN